MSGETIPEYLKHWSTVDPDKTAFIFTDANWKTRKYSRRDIFELSSKYAAILNRHGISRGDIVCNTLPNSPERLVTDFGCALAGAVALHGQTFLADGRDFFGSLKRTNCRAVILDSDDSEGAKGILDKHEHRRRGMHVNFPELPFLRLVMECHWTSRNGEMALMDLINDQTDMFVDDVDPDDDAYIFTTSGTTGFSKLVPRTHKEMCVLSKVFADIVKLEASDIYYNDRPLGWSGGYPYSYLVNGSVRVLVDLSKGIPKNDAEFMWELICKQRCTIGFIAPFDLERLTRVYENCRESDWRFRLVAAGGQPLTKLHMQAVGKMADAVVVMYGSTECGLMSYLTVTDVNVNTYKDCDTGVLEKNTFVRVVDKSLQDVPKGDTGEILIKGPGVCTYYLDNEKATREAFTEDGWFRTGDLGSIELNGHLHVIGRLKFAIMRGAYIIYPIWLELRIQSCPGVQNCVVVPVPDKILYQELCACVVLEPGSDISAEKLSEYCKSLFVTKEGSQMTAVPKYYVFFKTLPTNSNGKVSRNDLIELATEKLGLSSQQVTDKEN